MNKFYLYEVLIFPNKSLTTPTAYVKTVTDAIRTKLRRLEYTMNLHKGVGLAANQCGLKERLCVFGFESLPKYCINPTIVKTYGEPIDAYEGCLSSPIEGESYHTKRYGMIDLRFTDYDGIEHLIRVTNFSAVIVQHELDHLDGKIPYQIKTKLD